MPVYRDKTRQTWYVKFSHKDRSGGRKGVFKSGFSTKGEAQEWEMEQAMERTRRLRPDLLK